MREHYGEDDHVWASKRKKLWHCRRDKGRLLRVARAAKAAMQSYHDAFEYMMGPHGWDDYNALDDALKEVEDLL